MIDLRTYRRSGYLGIMLIFRMYGSVFPRVAAASFFVAVLTLVLKLEAVERWVDNEHFQLETTYGGNAYTFFNFVTAALVVLRVRVAYIRYWEAWHNLMTMCGRWESAFLHAATFACAMPSQERLPSLAPRPKVYVCVCVCVCQ